MAEYNFPNENEDPKKKGTKEYITKYGKAMYYHYNKYGYKMFLNDKDNFKKLIAFYQGNQPVSQYQKRLDCWDNENDNGKDEVFVNINWQILNFAFKFINIVIEKVAEVKYDIIATPIDPLSVIDKDRRKYFMQAVQDNKAWMQANGINLNKDLLGFDPSSMPVTPEELEVHMQMMDKDELALEAEIAVDMVFSQNKFDQKRREYLRYLALIGVCGVEERNTRDGRTVIEVIPPDSMVVSNSLSEDMTDMRYAGFVKNVTFNELKLMAGDQFNQAQYTDIYENHCKKISVSDYRREDSSIGTNIEKTTTIFKFYYKTTDNNTFEKKKDQAGNKKIYKTNINRGKSEEYQEKYAGEREILKDPYEVVYEGIWIVGTDYSFNCGMLNDMEVTQGNSKQTRIPIHAVAPNLLDGKVISMFYSMLPIFEEIQVNWLMFQHGIAKFRPDGVAIDIASLIEAPVGKGGKNMKAGEVIDMFIRTGILVFNGKTYSNNPNGVPIREIKGTGIEQAAGFLQNVLNLLNILRDLTGINQAMDASTPSADALVGVQQMAYSGAQSAIGFLYNADKLLINSLADSAVKLTQNLVKRRKVSGLTKALGTDSAVFWEINKNVALKDFGTSLEARPTEAEWNDFYLLLKDSLAKGQIDTDDYIDIKRVKNLKMASEMMKVRKKRKQEIEKQTQESNIKLQSEENAKSSIAIEQAKQQTLTLQYRLETESKLAVEEKKGEIQREKYMYEMMLNGKELESKDMHKRMESETKIITKWMDIQNNKDKASNNSKKP